MDHTQFVSATELDNFANMITSRAILPELIFHLIRQCVEELSCCRIPYGDASQQTGQDGVVIAVNSFREYVPAGTSYWEFGAGKDPEGKATKDFDKRTSQLPDHERSEATFVFVTPRSGTEHGWQLAKQTKWIKERKGRGWRDVIIIDGVKLADWLREFPAIGGWMWMKMGLSKRLKGIVTPKEHWDLLQGSVGVGDPLLPARLYTVGRAPACTALHKLFEGNSDRLVLFVESPSDATNFVAAYLASLDSDTGQTFANRCLIISDEDAWRSVVSSKASHVLVADHRLGLDSTASASLQTLARKAGHSVVIPIFSAPPPASHDTIRLGSPSSHIIESTLLEAGFSHSRATHLANVGGNMLASLERDLLGIGSNPPYSSWPDARPLAITNLIAKWDDSNAADRAAIEELLGNSYGEWMGTMREQALRPDSPLQQRENKWKLVARGEAWHSLGPRLYDTDLDQLYKVAVKVLGEFDPKFELPQDERIFSGSRGLQRVHSQQLREGLAESLALLGSRYQALSSCSHGKAIGIGRSIVRDLLDSDNWIRWASLTAELPLLCEAAPDEFLAAVERLLRPNRTHVIKDLFNQEGSDLGGWNYLSGILWGLETLAWHPDYLNRVTLILGHLAHLDPGGSWSNRPSSSLTNIFLPWHAQTTADPTKRLVAIRLLLESQPSVGWQLVLSLLPHRQGLATSSHRPAWREFIPNEWSEKVSVQQYWSEVSIYTDIASKVAESDTLKLAELIESIPSLPPPAQDKLLEHLASSSVADLEEHVRLPIWESLTDLVRNFRKHPNSDWMMNTERIDRIDVVAQSLAPMSIDLLQRYLFNGKDIDLFDDEDSYKEASSKLAAKRVAAVSELLAKNSVEGVLTFARSVSDPFQVGLALGRSEAGGNYSTLLQSWLATEDPSDQNVLAGYVHGKSEGSDRQWLDEILDLGWDVNTLSSLLALLPFTTETWQYVHVVLGDREGEYWSKVSGYAWCPSEDHREAVTKLVEYQRPVAAIHYLRRLVHSPDFDDPDLCLAALTSLIAGEDKQQLYDRHSVLEVLDRLQQSSFANTKELFRIEWHLLPILDRSERPGPKTLEFFLATTPGFFTELVALVFRSKNEGESSEEPSELQITKARNAYQLLSSWRTVPGVDKEKVLDTVKFRAWYDQATESSRASGRLEVALIQFGRVLAYAPPDPDGLWIHREVARILDASEAEPLRSGFSMGLYNLRGVHGFTSGEAEKGLSILYYERAATLDNSGFPTIAASVRKIADNYAQEAEQEALRDPFDD